MKVIDLFSGAGGFSTGAILTKFSGSHSATHYQERAMPCRKQISDKLRRNGFSGLYCPGECGCQIDDLAPCGYMEKEGEYINGCQPGHLFFDPDGSGFFIVCGGTEEPDEDEWKEYRLLCT